MNRKILIGIAAAILILIGIVGLVVVGSYVASTSVVKADPTEVAGEENGYCTEGAIGAYKCIGGEMKIVSSLPGKGSTYILQNGTSLNCPVVAPEEMSEECSKFLTEGYCLNINLCEL